MCGIAGKIDWQGVSGEEAVLKIRDRMVHRGPDDKGIICLKYATLGHRRLSIIDLSENARQPMASQDNRYHIVYNGEVYNFKELRGTLEGLGVNFKTSSDTEVVLNSYIKWGAKCLDSFNGMFAFAIWDDKTNELFLARDRFGKKPLYYYFDSRRFIFASELSALICDNDISKDISYEALNCYLALGYILAPMTLYKEVFKLEAATYMLVSDFGNNIKKVCYWDYAQTFRVKVASKENDISDNVLKLLDSSVKSRMVSDVPLGAFLSGGIDSSSVVSLAKKYHNGNLHTFSMGFEQKDYNELIDADRAAKHIGTIHHNVICKIDKDLSLLDAAIDAYDEPFADNSLVPMLELSKFTSAYVKVALSGDGADEIFAGYVTYKADKYYKYARVIPRPFLKLLVGFLKKTGSGNMKKIGLRYQLKQFFYGALFNQEKAHYSWRLIFNPEERIEILGEQYRQLVYETDPFFIFQRYYNKVKDLHWLDRSLYVDAMTWLTDDILVKVDRASMKNSIEVRSPYLDVNFASYVASIPPDLKMKGLETKYILKKSLRGVLPGFILNKRKSGFNAPIGMWLQSNRKDEFKLFNEYVFNKKVKNG